MERDNLLLLLIALLLAALMTVIALYGGRAPGPMDPGTPSSVTPIQGWPVQQT